MIKVTTYSRDLEMDDGDLRLIIQLLKTHAAYVNDALEHLSPERKKYLEVGIGCLVRAISVLEKE